MNYRKATLREAIRCMGANITFIRKIQEVAEESVIWVAEDGLKIVGVCVMANVPSPAADPAGWWLAYAFTSAEVRGAHIGVPLIRAALTDLNGRGYTPRLFRKPEDDRALIGAWNYVEAGAFSFLSCNSENGYQLYEANPLDLTWGL